MINNIYVENCLDTMKRMADESVDLVVTSPPYDNLRIYNGYSFDFESIATELFRIIKWGGLWFGLLVMQCRRELSQGLALSRLYILCL